VTHAQQRYFCATGIAIAVALILQMSSMPNPWPAAIAVYVYGLVAWPSIREEMLPNIRPSAYAALWVGAALLVFVYENLGAAAGW
jgi:hypothetical protein